MKKLLPFLSLCLLLPLISCDDECGGDILIFKVSPQTYKLSITDTILNGGSHEFEIKVSEFYGFNMPPMLDGVLYDTREFIYDSEYQIPIDDSEYFSDHQDDFYPFGKQKYAWLEIEPFKKNNEQWIKVKIDQNTSNETREVQFMVYAKPTGFNNDAIRCSNSVRIQQNPLNQSTFTVKARYKGIIYTSSAQFNEKNEIVYEDTEFQTLMESLSKKDYVETIVMDNEIVDYFDSDDMAAQPALKALMKKVDASRKISVRKDIIGSRSSDGFQNMSTEALGYFAIYDDDNFSDTNYYSNFTGLSEYYDQYSLKDIGLNDKVTSLVVSYNGTNSEVCSVLTVWEDSSYNHGDNDRTKHRISFIASAKNPRLSRPNLKNIPCLNSKDSWNDRISSLSFHFGNFGEYLRNY